AREPGSVGVSGPAQRGAREDDAVNEVRPRVGDPDGPVGSVAEPERDLHGAGLLQQGLDVLDARAEVVRALAARLPDTARVVLDDPPRFGEASDEAVEHGEVERVADQDAGADRKI